MNQDLLSQLKPIELPNEVGFWPLAWGWWALILLVIAIIMAFAVFSYLRLKRTKAYREQIKQLHVLSDQWQSNKDDQILAQQLNLLLREATVRTPNKKLVSGQIEKWRGFLAQQDNWFTEEAAIDFLMANYRPVKKCQPEIWLKACQEALKGISK